MRPPSREAPRAPNLAGCGLCARATVRALAERTDVAPLLHCGLADPGLNGLPRPDVMVIVSSDTRPSGLRKWCRPSGLRNGRAKALHYFFFFSNAGPAIRKSA